MSFQSPAAVQIGLSDIVRSSQRVRVPQVGSSDLLLLVVAGVVGKLSVCRSKISNSPFHQRLGQREKVQTALAAELSTSLVFERRFEIVEMNSRIRYACDRETLSMRSSTAATLWSHADSA